MKLLTKGRRETEQKTLQLQLHTRTQVAGGMPETVTVSVAQGDLKGRRATTKSGLQYYSFQGIPYAKPPKGSLRFKVSDISISPLP